MRSDKRDRHVLPPSFDILGTEVTPIDIGALTDLVFAPGHDGPRVFANVNLHALHLARDSDLMQQLFGRAFLTHVDGMSVIWVAQLLGHPFDRRHRVTYVDWQPEILRRADEMGSSVYFLGGAPGVGDRAAELISDEYPRVRFGFHHGFLAESEPVLRAIGQFAPDVLFVGMGMPRQEQWIVEHWDALPNCSVLPCGASFDYFTGVIRTPPRWMGRVGLEWSYRLCMEPRRLWRRYLLEPLALTPRVLAAIAARDWRLDWSGGAEARRRGPPDST